MAGQRTGTDLRAARDVRPVVGVGPRLVRGQRAGTPRPANLSWSPAGAAMALSPGRASARREVPGSGRCGAVWGTFLVGGSRLAQRCQFFSQRMAAATRRLWLRYGARPVMVRARNPRAIPHVATAATAHSMMVSAWMTSMSMLSFFSPACRGGCCDGNPQRDCLLSYPTVPGFVLKTVCLTPDSTALATMVGTVGMWRRADPADATHLPGHGAKVGAPVTAPGSNRLSCARHGVCTDQCRRVPHRPSRRCAANSPTCCRTWSAPVLHPSPAPPDLRQSPHRVRDAP